MDTENFIVARSRITEQLQARRALDFGKSPLGIMQEFGIHLPAWARFTLSFMTQNGVLSRFLEVGLPLAIPFLFRKRMPFMERFVQRIFSPKS